MKRNFTLLWWRWWKFSRNAPRAPNDWISKSHGKLCIRLHSESDDWEKASWVIDPEHAQSANLNWDQILPHLLESCNVLLRSNEWGLVHCPSYRYHRITSVDVPSEYSLVNRMCSWCSRRLNGEEMRPTPSSLFSLFHLSSMFFSSFFYYYFPKRHTHTHAEKEKKRVSEK